MKWIAIVFLFVIKIKGQPVFIDSPVMRFDTCLQQDVEASYLYGALPEGEENQYTLTIKKYSVPGTIIVMKFDSEVFVKLDSLSSTLVGISTSDKIINITVYKNIFILKITVKGGVNGKVPYLSSLLINGVENCRVFVTGSLNKIVEDLRLLRQVRSSLKQDECGRRKLDFTDLILNGESSKPGEWPWHAAIYRHKGSSNLYICGGTLISKLFVLTAAHCVTINDAAVVPDILSVVLGKYHLVGSDISSQEKEVFSVIVHEEFRRPEQRDNDIALLKLMTEASYNNYVQPACVWTSHTPSTDQIIGTVVGWGFTETNDLASELQQASFPLIPEPQCIKSNPAFYGPLLSNDRKFCAGWRNGKSPCNGDSGGGFLVHVPDDSGTAGVWYVRGIVSHAKALSKKCDGDQYVVFTDISKYETWIRAKTYDKI